MKKMTTANSIGQNLKVVIVNNMDAKKALPINAYGFVKVTSLLDACVQSVINCLPQCIEKLTSLPDNLKDRCLYLMSKRGVITDSNIDKVIHRNLKVLDLSESDVSDTCLQHLSKCPSLRKLDLNSAKESRTNVTSQGIVQLANSCHWLQTVYIRRCINITDEAIEALSVNCPQLKFLNIGGCKCLTDRSLEALGKHSKFLQSVNISNTQITDQGVISLVSGNCAATLKEFHVNSCPHLTDTAIEAVLQFCPQINILLFHGCPKITENSRQALEDLTLERNSPMKQVTWTVY